MDSVHIELLVGFLILGFGALDGNLKQISIHWVKLLLAIIFIALAIYGFDPLTLR